MFALVAVDPRTPGAFVDSLRSLTHAGRGDEWGQQVALARLEFPRRMLARRTTRSLPADVQVTDGEGVREDLRTLPKGNLALVVFWSRFCGPALDALPQVDSLASRLLKEGVQVVTIVEEPPSHEFARFINDKRVTMPVYHDFRGEASLAFNNWGTPQYYVLDVAGRIRFDYAESVRDILAQLEAVRLDEASQ